MVYKWVGPFNEMYIKLKEQLKKNEDEIVLMELFDDLFAETYREDSLSRKRRQNQDPSVSKRNQIIEIRVG